MIDAFVIGSGLVMMLLVGSIAAHFLKPKSFSSEELGCIAFGLVGFIIGVLLAEFALVIFF